MKISKISPAVKTEGRYNIFVDDQYSFSLDEHQLMQLGIYSGMELTEQELDKLRNESNFGKNYIRAIDLISRRLRSEREIIDYGRRKGWTADNIERVVNRLTKRGYLDDERFANMFANNRKMSGKYSVKRIKYDLAKKGISKSIIDKLDLNDNDDKLAIESLIKKHGHKYKDLQKLIAFLARKGFRYDDIKRAVADFSDFNDSSDVG